MEKILLEILACPVCKGELLYDHANQELICRFDRLAYPIVNEIPVMLESRARRLSSEEDN
ncbi:MAG: Trm112 family protein [Gammaproteobacteria bacterium]|nr:Trm112 family protein [Gammaproteobacteria bacterium]MCW5582763.1 Trm112 family protein [Gammaproteobacteria bacterium]